MKKNNLKKINLQKIKKILENIFSSIGSKFKKIKPVKTKKEETTPDWFNKNLEKEELSSETKEELEDFLKEYV